MKKRLLSLALCLALCLGLLPVGVLATDGEGGGVYVPPSTSTGGGGVYVETHPVTVISGETEKGYDSIIEAFNNVDDGGTIRLNNDVTLEASPEVSGKNITLNLNGYVLGSNSSLTVKSGAALTVTNAGAENSEKPITAGLSLKLLVEKGGSFTCTDGKISSLGLLSAGEGDYNLKLSEGENHCTFGGFAQGDGNATVGDLLKATPGMALHADNSGSDVQITRSTLISKGFNYFSFYVGPCSEHKMGEDGTCDYCGASYVTSVEANGHTTYYTSFIDAVNASNAIKSECKLTMLADTEITNEDYENIPEIKSFLTLDLNGYTITNKVTQVLLYVCSPANVTICDSSTQQTGRMVNESTSSPQVINLQSGNLTIAGGTFESVGYLGYALSIQGNQDDTLNIEGGTFIGRVDIPGGTYAIPTSISRGTFTNLNVFWSPLSSVLAKGYGFKSGNQWLTGEQLAGENAYNVSVSEAPDLSIDVTSNKTEYSYGDPITLSAELSGSDNNSPFTYQWYLISYQSGNHSITPISGVSSATYTPPNLLPNNHGYDYDRYIYYCAATRSDGYTVGNYVKFTVKQVDLSNADVTVSTPTYTGTTQSPNVEVKMGNKTLDPSTDYTVTAAPQTNAGNYTLTITGQGNYTGTKTLEWKIKPMKIDHVMFSKSISKTYDGTAKFETQSGETYLTFYDAHMQPVSVPAEVYEISDVRFGTEDADHNFVPSAEAGNKAGIQFTITFKSNNYVLQASDIDEPASALTYTQYHSANFTINKATVLNTTAATLTVANNHQGTYTFDLKALLPTLDAPQSYGTISYGTPTISLDNYYTEGAKIEDGVLSVPIDAVNSTEESNIGTIAVVVTTENYNDITLTLNVSAANKTVPTGTPTLSKTNLTYGDKLSDITLSGSMTDEENAVAGTFTWENPNEILTAGKHQAGWIFTPTDSAHYIEVTGESEVTVAKATPSGTPSYTAITESGKTLEDAHLAVGTLQPEGFIQWVDANGKEINVSTEVKANTAYTWKFMPDDKENYTPLTGTITLWHKSSSGSSSGSVTPETKTDTVKNPDGSTTKTETKADGSKTETTTASSGGGSTGTTVTKTDAKGNTTTEASAKLSDQDVKEAQEKGEAVTVPVKGIAAAKDANAATKIKIDVPNNANKTTVEIPVENVTSGTVAVIVHEDGTEEIVKDSIPTERSVQLELSGSATVKIIDNSKDFIDTRDHWSRDEVNFVAARELFNGVGNNLFGVSQPMTRGMVNTVLARLSGVDTTPGQGQAWYEVGTDWAKKNGISDGTNPTAPVTREQLATLLYRYAGSPSVSGTLHAADAASVSDYAEDALLWANQNGIVNGVGSNTIAPKDNAQRAQVAAMLARYLQNQ